MGLLSFSDAYATEKLSFSMKDFLSNCDHILRKLQFGHIDWKST